MKLLVSETPTLTMVVDPVKHRVNLRQASVDYYKIYGKPPNVIDTVIDYGLPDDLWICDVCNDDIQLIPSEAMKQYGFGRSPIIQDDSYAYCTKCFMKLLIRKMQGRLAIKVCNCCIDTDIFDSDEKMQGFIMFWLGDVKQSMSNTYGKDTTFVPVAEDDWSRLESEEE
tara:strand:- start:848 stop:1354 length:507 start_codon:yes stop_codon:yes gene_type:complete